MVADTLGFRHCHWENSCLDTYVDSTSEGLADVQGGLPLEACVARSSECEHDGQREQETARAQSNLSLG